MRIRMLKISAGPAGTFAIGQEREVDDAHGLALVIAGAAEEIAAAAPPRREEPVMRVETAMALPAPETATAPPMRQPAPVVLPRVEPPKRPTKPPARKRK